MENQQKQQTRIHRKQLKMKRIKLKIKKQMNLKSLQLSLKMDLLVTIVAQHRKIQMHLMGLK